MATITENKKETLLELHGQLDDGLSNLMNELENDETVTQKTWDKCDENYKKLSRILRQIFEEIFYS